MPTRLKRYYGQGQLHFVTFSCYRRLALLGTARARNMFVKELSRVRREYGFLLVGYVVMPNHVHLLMSEPKKGTPSTVMQMLKQRVSRKFMSGRTFPWAPLNLSCVYLQRCIDMGRLQPRPRLQCQREKKSCVSISFFLQSPAHSHLPSSFLLLYSRARPRPRRDRRAIT